MSKNIEKTAIDLVLGLSDQLFDSPCKNLHAIFHFWLFFIDFTKFVKYEKKTIQILNLQ